MTEESRENRRRDGTLGERVPLKTKDGREFSLLIPERSRSRHVFVLSSARCGSTLMNKMIKGYLSEKGIGYVSLARQFFEAGVRTSDIRKDIYPIIDERPSIYLGFRQFFNLDKCRRFPRATKIVLVRDPRDALVSHYYSVRQSHRLHNSTKARERQLNLRHSAQQIDINKFITQVSSGLFVPETMRRYAKLNQRNTTYYRYEDVVFRKREWLEHMLRVMNVDDIDLNVVARIAERHDVRPTSEQPSEHIRQVTPGNYRKQLDADTVRWIEERYPDLFHRFGYTFDFPELGEATRGSVRAAQIVMREPADADNGLAEAV